MLAEIFRGNKEKIEICTFQELEIFVWVLNVVRIVPLGCTKGFLLMEVWLIKLYMGGVLLHFFLY